MALTHEPWCYHSPAHPQTRRTPTNNTRASPHTCTPAPVRTRDALAQLLGYARELADGDEPLALRVKQAEHLGHVGAAVAVGLQGGSLWWVIRAGEKSVVGGGGDVKGTSLTISHSPNPNPDPPPHPIPTPAPRPTHQLGGHHVQELVKVKPAVAVAVASLHQRKHRRVLRLKPQRAQRVPQLLCVNGAWWIQGRDWEGGVGDKWGGVGKVWPRLGAACAHVSVARHDTRRRTPLNAAAIDGSYNAYMNIAQSQSHSRSLLPPRCNHPAPRATPPNTGVPRTALVHVKQLERLANLLHLRSGDAGALKRGCGLGERRHRLGRGLRGVRVCEIRRVGC